MFIVIFMLNNLIKAVPDYLPLSFQEFVRHFGNLFSKQGYKHWNENNEFITMLGYSCRTLFEMCMSCFEKEDLVVATTPLHHTSYRNIIEDFVKLENIHVIALNEEYNQIAEVPEVEKCHVVVITYLFGQDMDLSILSDFKKKHDCLIIEDRVQGGSLDRKFSHELVDIAIYSMGMDKRPIALGGGYLYIKKRHQEFFKKLNKLYLSLQRKKNSERFIELLKKVPTYLLYNVRPFLYLFIMTLEFLSLFSEKFDIVNVTKFYRKKNPGFIRSYCLYRPSFGLMKSMVENYNNHKKVDKLYSSKYDQFVNSLSPVVLEHFFPWYKGNTCYTAYNTILIEEHLVDRFMVFMNSYTISTLANPTYKMFNKEYEGDTKDKKFNDGIVYLPSHVAMNQEEMDFLNDRLVEFYIKFVKKK